VPERPGASEPELRETLATLQTELRASPVDAAVPAAQVVITELTALMAALEAASVEARSALERQLVERGHELERIRMDLELARLVPPSGCEEDARVAEPERRGAAKAAARKSRLAQ